MPFRIDGAQAIVGALAPAVDHVSVPAVDLVFDKAVALRVGTF
jgi:hypothetical protein